MQTKVKEPRRKEQLSKPLTQRKLKQRGKKDEEDEEKKSKYEHNSKKKNEEEKEEYSVSVDKHIHTQRDRKQEKSWITKKTKQNLSDDIKKEKKLHCIYTMKLPCIYTNALIQIAEGKKKGNKIKIQKP